MDKSVYKKYIKYVFLVVFLLLFILAVTPDFTLGEFVNTLKNVDVSYLFIAFMLIVFNIILVGTGLTLISKIEEPQVPIKNTMLISGTASFFNGVTPFAVGGQPFQIYYYSKSGVKTANATGIIALRFMVFQFSLILVGAISLFLAGNIIATEVTNFNRLIILGFTINASILLFTLLFSVSGRAKKILFYPTISLLSKIKPLKKRMEKTRVNGEKQIANFQENLSILLKHKPTLLIAIFVEIIGLILKYSIPFFVLKAVGIELTSDDFVTAVCFAAFISIFAAWVPTPGSSGGNEYAFLVLFSLFAPVASAADGVFASGMLLWRIITYYCVLVYGFIAVLIYERVSSK